MRRPLALAGVVLITCTPAAVADGWTRLERFVQRTPLPRVPVEHSMARAGYPQSVSRLAAPSMTRFDHGGYVGGASLRNNNLLARGPGSATGPLYYGTYGTDYAGLRSNLGRLFLAPSTDPSRGHAVARNYRAEGPRVTDIYSLRPFRKAVLEMREDEEERHHGGEGHGEGGHGAEGDHGPAGAGKEGGHGPAGAGKEAGH